LRLFDGSGSSRDVIPDEQARRPGLEPGPITTGCNRFTRWPLSFFSNNAGRGVWVPAFAGTTATAR
jgi:hypothetical protein